MNNVVAGAANRPRARWPLSWWLAVGLMFVVQLGLIVWLSDRRPPGIRPPGAAPGLQLLGPGSASIMAYLDPTLFALPHPQGFSGPGWLDATNQPYQPFFWEAQPGWLELPTEGLGAAFGQFIATNKFSSTRVATFPEPESVRPEWCEPQVFSGQSSLRLAGELAGRQMLTAPELRSWTNSDMLTNSVIETLVDAQGRPLSVALLPPGSGSREADLYALERARATRFNSTAVEGPEHVGHASGHLTWGQLIFQWHTIPKPQANAPAAK
ncbi:MAG TPA: hypothetical protein VG167_03335 [Verrucomicrobiae bacterium]|nr:hypothetical protein [Verrucomicrobiae bacterium]